MKLIILMVFINFGFYCCLSQSTITSNQNDCAIYNRLKKIDLNKYIGKTVRELLEDPFIKGYKDKYFLEERPRSLAGLGLMYSSKIYIKVYTKIEHQNQICLSGEWSYDKLLEEIIEDIVIKKYQH